MPKISLIKHHFFNKSPNKFDEFSFKEDDFDLNHLKSEFSSLYQLFLSNKQYFQREDEIVLYMNNLCDLMIRYYQCDYVEADLRNLLKKKKEIEKFINGNVFEEQHDSVAASYFSKEGISQNTLNYAATFTSSSKLRGFISSIITNRSYWNYSRSWANYLIIYLQNNGFSDFIKEVNEKIGHHYSTDEFIKLLEAPQNFLRVLSFGLYALRLMINLVTMAKHIIQAAMSKELSGKKVLIQEMEKRGYSIANDIVWGSVSLLSNFNRIFNLSSLIVAQINLVFLTFDLALFVLYWSIEMNHYNNSVRMLLLQQKTAVSWVELSVINRQLDILGDEWEVQCAYYQFNMIAACLFIIAFSSTFILTGPLALGCLAALSMLANALNNTVAEYKKYKQASIAVQREVTNGKILKDEHHYELLNELNEECSKSNIIFWKSLIYNTTATAFIITAAAISWPIACLLTISYVAYRLHDTYQKSQLENGKKQVTHDIYRLFGTDKTSLTSEEPVNQTLSYQSNL